MYALDTSAENLAFTLQGDNPQIQEGYTCEVKKLVSSGKITVDATGGPIGGTIDDSATISITGKNDSVTFYYQGDGKWKIV